MSSGYSAAVAQMVSQKFVKKMVPKEWKAFLGAMKEQSDPWSIDNVADVTNYEGQAQRDLPKSIYEAYLALQKAFEVKTGLHLDLAYHNSADDGSRYDDVTGAFWCVDGVFQRTCAGHKYKKDIKEVRYVTYG